GRARPRYRLGGIGCRARSGVRGLPGVSGGEGSGAYLSDLPEAAGVGAPGRYGLDRPRAAGAGAVTAAALFAALLFYASLTLWVPERWAWSLFQVGVFLLAGWRVGRARSIRPTPAAATLAGAWPRMQVAAGGSVAGGETWMAALDWAAFLVVFLVAKDILSGQRERHWFLGAISLGGMTVAAAAVLQDYSSSGKIFWLFPSGYTEGVLGPFVNRNQYAAWVELLLPAALYLAVTARRRVLYGAAAGGGAVGRPVRLLCRHRHRRGGVAGPAGPPGDPRHRGAAHGCGARLARQDRKST